MTMLRKIKGIAAIDFETANEKPASVISVGVSVMEDGILERKVETLIRPKKNVGYFRRGNMYIHGIRPSDVRDAPEWPEVLKMLEPYFDGYIWTAHNAGFDMGCLKAACRNYGLPYPPLRYFDTVELSRRVFPQIEHHRLNDVCDYLHVELDHHQAGSDAYGCLMIVACTMNLAGTYDIEELLKQCNTALYEL